jgi:hypothetical protein
LKQLYWIKRGPTITLLILPFDLFLCQWWNLKPAAEAGTVIEHSHHHPKVKCSSNDVAAITRREDNGKEEKTLTRWARDIF